MVFQCEIQEERVGKENQSLTISDKRLKSNGDKKEEERESAS
jgi:hypothetical protein